MKWGMLFPSYGAQFVGMGKDLYDRERLVQEYFEEAAICLNTNFVKLIFASSEVELAKITQAYTALFLMGACSAGLVKERGQSLTCAVPFDTVGFYSALFASGSISLPDGLYMLNKIGTAYEEFLATNPAGVLLVAGMTKRKLQGLVSEQLSYAGTYLKGEHIITGPLQEVELFKQELGEVEGVNVSTLEPGFGLYSDYAAQYGVPLADYLEKIDIKTPECAIISPLTGKRIKRADQLRLIARTILYTPLALDAVLKQLTPDIELIAALPASKLPALIERPLHMIEPVKEPDHEQPSEPTEQS